MRARKKPSAVIRKVVSLDMKVKRKKQIRTKRGWESRAYNAGALSADAFLTSEEFGGLPENPEWKRRLNEAWVQWFRKYSFTRFPQQSYPIACKRFIEGFCRTAKIELHPGLLMPSAKKVACIITARNEELTLQDQLNELTRLPFEEIIVVVNGSTDNSYRIVRDHPAKAIVVHFDSALGYDVGRAVGAKVSSSDILLFLDGDMCIPSELLLPFIYEAELGADIVLNPLSSIVPNFAERDAVSMMKEFLNRCLGRSDLHVDSLTAVPHAISRKAIKRLGSRILAIPPLAQARAIHCGLSVVKSSVVVDVFRSNRFREGNHGRGNPVEQLIIGDHLEAIYYLMKDSGHRLGFQDPMRDHNSIGRGQA